MAQLLTISTFHCIEPAPLLARSQQFGIVMQALMYKNSSHQVILPIDSPGETIKADLCRTYCMVAAASPLYSPSASRGQGVLSTKELFKVMLSNIRYSSCSASS